jgi:hypothetical protein
MILQRNDVLDKTTLLVKIEEGKADFDSLVTGFSDAQLKRSGVCGEWSVKDIVAHIAVHEQRMLSWMTEKLLGGAPKEYQPYALPDVQLDALNYQIYLDNVGRPWEDVQQDWESAHKKTLDWIRSVDEQTLFDAGKFHLLDGEPLWVAVAANTYEHCEEHGKDICAWMVKGQ